MSIIDDGSGSGRSARVGSANRVHTHSLSATVLDVAAMRGDVFDINSDLITLTTANESGVLYLKNNENEDISLIITEVNLGTSAGGSGENIIKGIFNITGGTLLSNAVDANINNRRIGDTSAVTVDAYQGVEGDTVVGGTAISRPLGGSAKLDTEYIIPKGNSIAVSITPPVGNTSMRMQISYVIVKNYPTYTIE